MRLVDQYFAKESKVLDLGCGSGYLSIRMADKGYKITGIDGSLDMINFCNEAMKESKTKAIEFRQVRIPDDIADFGRKNSFNGVIASSVFEYLDDLPGAMQWLHGLMEDGAILIASMPNRHSLYRKFERISYAILRKPGYLAHVRNMTTERSFMELAKNCGFETIESQFFGKSIIQSNRITCKLIKMTQNTLIAFVLQKKGKPCNN